MERRPLKIIRRRINLLNLKLIVFWLIVMVVCVSTARWIGVWGITLLGFGGLMAFGFLQSRLSLRYLLWTMLTAHCPECGASPLNYKSSSNRHGFLICEKCQIEWDLGPGTGVLGKLGNTGEVFAKNFSEIIDKQVQNDYPPETRHTIGRLKSEGHSTDEARQLISAAVAVEVFHNFCDRKPFNGERYAWNLKRLPQMPWDEHGRELYRA